MKKIFFLIFNGMISILRRSLLALIYIWQNSLSPLLGPRCRFYPSCSQYACESLKQDSLAKAMYKTCLRLLKCHPFHPGGIDLP